jgi:hypothetical protein
MKKAYERRGKGRIKKKKKKRERIDTLAAAVGIQEDYYICAQSVGLS